MLRGYKEKVPMGMIKSFASLIAAAALSLGVLACSAPTDETPAETARAEPAAESAEQAIGGARVTVAGGKGVVEIEKRDTGICTGFALNPYMIFTAAHCVYSGRIEGSAEFKVRYTTNGTSWTCISGPTSSGRCSSWATMNYYAGDSSPPWPASTDWAVVYRTAPMNINFFVGFAPPRALAGIPYQVWGRGMNRAGSGSGVMRYGGADISSLGSTEWYTSSNPQYKHALCEGDSGGPAFAWNRLNGKMEPYAIGVSSQISAPNGGVAGLCAVSGDRELFYRVTKTTVNNVNWILDNRLGRTVCPHCVCKEMGSIYPGLGWENYYYCDAV
jgi:V8-like Glu-specific endopeptidase